MSVHPSVTLVLTDVWATGLRRFGDSNVLYTHTYLLTKGRRLPEERLGDTCSDVWAT